MFAFHSVSLEHIDFDVILQIEKGPKALHDLSKWSAIPEAQLLAISNLGPTVDSSNSHRNGARNSANEWLVSQSIREFEVEVHMITNIGC